MYMLWVKLLLLAVTASALVRTFDTPGANVKLLPRSRTWGSKGFKKLPTYQEPPPPTHTVKGIELNPFPPDVKRVGTEKWSYGQLYDAYLTLYREYDSYSHMPSVLADASARAVLNAPSTRKADKYLKTPIDIGGHPITGKGQYRNLPRPMKQVGSDGLLTPGMRYDIVDNNLRLHGIVDRHTQATSKSYTPAETREKQEEDLIAAIKLELDGKKKSGNVHDY